MGRGDIKTKRGKISSGSFGKKRPAKQPKAVPVQKEKEEAAAPKRSRAPKAETK